MDKKRRAGQRFPAALRGFQASGWHYLLVDSLFEVLSFDSLEGAVLGLAELEDEDAEGEGEEAAGGVGALELELEDDGLVESARGDTGVELDGLDDDADEDGLPASRLSQP